MNYSLDKLLWPLRQHDTFGCYVWIKRSYTDRRRYIEISAHGNVWLVDSINILYDSDEEDKLSEMILNHKNAKQYSTEVKQFISVPSYFESLQIAKDTIDECLKRFGL